MRLRIAIGERSNRAIAAEAGIDHVTLANILAGRSWPDLLTLARLENGLDAELWRRPQISSD